MSASSAAADGLVLVPSSVVLCLPNLGRGSSSEGSCSNYDWGGGGQRTKTTTTPKRESTRSSKRPAIGSIPGIPLHASGK